MKQLLELIRIMTPREIQTARTVFKEAPRFAKRSQLFEAAHKNEFANDQEASMLLYQKLPNSAFSHMKARLLKQLYELVVPGLEATSLNGSSPTRKGVWRALILGQFFLDRGAAAIAMEIAREGKLKAVQSQLSTEILLLENLCLRTQSWFPDTDATDAQVNISDCAMLLARQIEARKCFQELDHLMCMDNPRAESLPPLLAQAILEIPELLENQLPPETRYWSLMTLIQYLVLIEDIPRALEKGRNLIATLEQYADQFNGYHHDHAALVWARLNCEAGQENLVEPVLQGLLSQNTTDQRVRAKVLETQFLLAFYKKDLPVAREKLKEAQDFTLQDPNSFAHAKWTFYAANMAFLNQDFEAVLKCLRSCSQLLKSKSKWLPGMKILEVFALLELEELELAEYRLEALRQLLKRQKQNDIRRARIICKLIGTYIRQGYAPQAVLKDSQGLLYLHWRPFNFEVLSLEHWLSELAKKPRLSSPLRKIG